MLLQICCSFRDHEGLFYLKVCFQHKEVVVFLYTHVTNIVIYILRLTLRMMFEHVQGVDIVLFIGGTHVIHFH